jgi:hypothetical protein
MLDFLLAAYPPTYTVPHIIGGLRQFKLGGRDNIRFENLRCRQKRNLAGIHKIQLSTNDGPI